MTAPAQTLLIVDDEFSIVETLSEILSWEGYAVASAPNGRLGLEALAASRPSLVLVDYMMPVMDGLEMLQALRRDPAHAGIPAILMSAARVVAPPEGGLYDALLRKPFEVARLLGLVRALLEAPRR